jgi:glycosyltransferase involved in cell wall biosynthesis
VIVALIPAHDEVPRIAAVVSAALEFLPVIVVDDGSTDATAERAREAGAEVIEQRPNQGKGMALRTGFR